MNGIKLFAKNKKGLETNRPSNNIRPGHGDGNCNIKMLHASNEKRQTTPGGRNGTAKSRKT